MDNVQYDVFGNAKKLKAALDGGGSFGQVLQFDHLRSTGGTLFIAAIIALLCLIAAYNQGLIGYYWALNGGVFVGNEWCNAGFEIYGDFGPGFFSDCGNIQY